MPWRCPACQLPIEHGLGEMLPRSGIVYRCHICRLELIFDDTASRLIVAPFPKNLAELEGSNPPKPTGKT